MLPDFSKLHRSLARFFYARTMIFCFFNSFPACSPYAACKKFMQFGLAKEPTSTGLSNFLEKTSSRFKRKELSHDVISRLVVAVIPLR